MCEWVAYLDVDTFEDNVFITFLESLVEELSKQRLLWNKILHRRMHLQSNSTSETERPVST